ncbi:MAG: prefoldin subunit alpha [Candidatus Hadarchaeales archaeon]
MNGLTEEEGKRLEEISAQIEERRAIAEFLRRQISALGDAVGSIGATVEALRRMKEVQPGTEILVPVGPETFVPARSEKQDKVLVGVGADVVVEKPIDDAIKFLEERSDELQRAMTSIGAEAMKVEEQLEKLIPERDALLGKAMKESEGGSGA